MRAGNKSFTYVSTGSDCATVRPDRCTFVGYHRSTRCWVAHGIWQLLVIVTLPANADFQTTTQTLAANVSPYGRVSIPSSVNLRSSNTRFGGFSGTLEVSYWARTS